MIKVVQWLTKVTNICLRLARKKRLNMTGLHQLRDDVLKQLLNLLRGNDSYKFLVYSKIILNELFFHRKPEVGVQCTLYKTQLVICKSTRMLFCCTIEIVLKCNYNENRKSTVAQCQTPTSDILCKTNHLKLLKRK